MVRGDGVECGGGGFLGEDALDVAPWPSAWHGCECVRWMRELFLGIESCLFVVGCGC